MADDGENTKKRKREDGEGSSAAAEDTPREEESALVGQPNDLIVEKRWGNDVLPPPSDPPEEGTCWAQATVMCMEANYRIMYARHNLEFPALSVKDCVFSLRGLSYPTSAMPLNHFNCTLPEVCSWLIKKGVATDEAFARSGTLAEDRYKIIGRSPPYMGEEIVNHLNNSVLIGGFQPDDYEFTGSHYIHKPKHDNKKTPDQDEAEKEKEVDHLVMVIGWGRLNGKNCLIYYSGYNTVETMELECMEFGCELLVPDKPLPRDIDKAKNKETGDQGSSSGK